MKGSLYLAYRTTFQMKVLKYDLKKPHLKSTQKKDIKVKIGNL